MRLIKLRLKDFRRFSGEHALDLNEDLIALVGPNEAGKSSLLYAIELLGAKQVPKSSDITRGQAGPAEIRGLYVLDEEDREAIREIHQGDLVTHLWVILSSAKDRASYSLEQWPRRDLAPRQRALELLAAIENDPVLDERYSESESVKWQPQLMQSIQTHLTSDAETLQESIVQSFESLAQRLRGLKPPLREAGDSPEVESVENEVSASATREAAAASLVELAALERRPTPSQEAAQALLARTGSVAWFREEDRTLQSTYKLPEIVSAIPAALRNLCEVAGIDLKEVHVEIQRGRLGHVEKLFETANVALKEKFQSSWTQSDVYLRLGTASDGVLRIFVSTEGEADYSEPEERSDGLRWFVALHSFLLVRRHYNPILLVDEAESHLHYDAQADLIDTLMSQRLVSKVVYSTHSVGCLPPDLGTGIRAVLAERGAERSRIANSYWSVEPEHEDRVGYAPLLFAMGARLLSLTIPRFGVVVEGPSDAILLPSLLREAAGIAALPYRVVPGLTELAKGRESDVTQHAGRLVCLTDDDDGGKKLRERLLAAGLSVDAVRHLGEAGPGCTLEDLVPPDVFSDAVIAEIKTWSIGSIAPESPGSTDHWALEVAGEAGRIRRRFHRPAIKDAVRTANRGPRTPRGSWRCSASPR